MAPAEKKKKNAPYTSKQGIWVGHQNGRTSTLFLIRSSNGISPRHRSIVSAFATWKKKHKKACSIIIIVQLTDTNYLPSADTWFWQDQTSTSVVIRVSKNVSFKFVWKHKWPELYLIIDTSTEERSSVEAIALYNICNICSIYSLLYEKMFIRVAGIYTALYINKSIYVLIFHTDNIQRWYKFPIMQHDIWFIYITDTVIWEYHQLLYRLFFFFIG